MTICLVLPSPLRLIPTPLSLLHVYITCMTYMGYVACMFAFINTCCILISSYLFVYFCIYFLNYFILFICLFIKKNDSWRKEIYIYIFFFFVKWNLLETLMTWLIDQRHHNIHHVKHQACARACNLLYMHGSLWCIILSALDQLLSNFPSPTRSC